MKPAFLIASFFCLFAVIFAVAAGLQTGSPAAQPSAAKITAAGIWQPPQEIFAKASQVCQVGAGPVSFPACYMNQLTAQGEPPEAAKFTRWLFEHFDQNVGILTAFKSYAPLDAAQVMIPLRANSNYALLLVNGDPAVINVDDLEMLDRKAMEADPLFQSVMQKYPKVEFFPGDRSGSAPWPRVQALPGGGAEFVVSYPLLNGCHACQPLGQARFGWDFDADGKFLRTVYIPTSPPPKRMRPARTLPPSQ